MRCDPKSGSMRWYVFQAEPSSEFVALDRLSIVPGVTPYMPIEIKRRRKMRGGRPILLNGKYVLEEVKRPFFVGYGLVRFDVSDPSWGAIKYTEGVKRLLCNTIGSPLPISDAAVNAIRAQGRAGDGAIDLQAVQFPLEVGQKVTVGGPFGDMAAVIQSADSARITVLMGALVVSVGRAQVKVA